MRTKLIGFIALLSIVALAGCGSSGNSNAGNQLSSLAILSGTLSPTFASGTADYTVSVENSVTSITVTPTAKDSGATITVNDVDVNSGAASGSIDLAVGANTITVKVTAKDGKATYTYTVTVTRAAITAGGIGSSCSCDTNQSGNTCVTNGVPVPSGSPIIGCDNVQTDFTGLVKLCLRSFDGGNTGIPSTYFANGYCSLGATSCTGNSLVCDFAVFGTYNDTTNSCPTGLVMIKDTKSVLGIATLNTQVCAKPCTSDNDCRSTETDPKFNATTQYKCVLDKDPVKFCYDPRNLSGSYTVQAF